MNPEYKGWETPGMSEARRAGRLRKGKPTDADRPKPKPAPPSLEPIPGQLDLVAELELLELEDDDRAA